MQHLNRLRNLIKSYTPPSNISTNHHQTVTNDNNINSTFVYRNSIRIGENGVISRMDLKKVLDENGMVLAVMDLQLFLTKLILIIYKLKMSLCL